MAEPLTLGVEEELQLIDMATFRLAGRAPALLAQLPPNTSPANCSGRRWRPTPMSATPWPSCGPRSSCAVSSSPPWRPGGHRHRVRRDTPAVHRRRLRADQLRTVRPHDRALLEDLSPLHQAVAIAAPLLVVHGSTTLTCRSARRVNSWPRWRRWAGRCTTSNWPARGTTTGAAPPGSSCWRRWWPFSPSTR